MGLDKSSPQEFTRPWGASTHRVRSGTLENPPGEFQVSFFRFFCCPRREDPRLVILLNWTTGKTGIVFQNCSSPEGGPPARNPLKIRKIGPLEKQVSFFGIFCPRRAAPRLVIHLKSGKLDPWKNRCRFSDLFAPGGRTPGS